MHVPRVLVHGNDIRGRYVWLYVVNGTQYVAPALCQVAYSPFNLASYLLRSAVGQNVLGVDSAPETDTLSVGPLELSAVHVCRRYLDRIQYVYTCLYEVFEEVPYGAAGSDDQRG